MSSIAQLLADLEQARRSIIARLKDKGVDVADGEGIAAIPPLIDNIPTESAFTYKYAPTSQLSLEDVREGRAELNTNDDATQALDDLYVRAYEDAVWDLRGIHDVHALFKDYEFSKVPKMLGWENVTIASYLFDGAPITEVPDLDYSNIIYAQGMFIGTDIREGVISLPNAERVSGIFGATENNRGVYVKNECLETVDVTAKAWGWSTLSFDWCAKLRTIRLNCDTSMVTDMSRAFAGCVSLEALPDLDTSNVTNMDQLCIDKGQDKCERVTRFPAWDMSQVRTSDTTVPVKMAASGIMKGLPNVETIDAYGMTNSWDLRPCTKLSAEELNKVMRNLGTAQDGAILYITGCAGANECDKSIATAKGWQVQ